MSSPAAPTSRPSLSGTVLRLTAIALVAAVLVWSVLFVDVLSKHSEAAAAPAPLTGQVSGPEGAQAPTPVTTRSS